MRIDILLKDVFYFLQEGGNSDSELEQEKLLELEDVLRYHDPEFDSAGSSVPMVPGETHQLHDNDDSDDDNYDNDNNNHNDDNNSNNGNDNIRMKSNNNNSQ